MNGIGIDEAPAPATREKPSDGFVGAGLGIFFIVVLRAIAATNGLPYVAAWPIETLVFIGSFTAMTLYKRSRWGWAWTGYVIAASLAEAVAHVIGVADSSPAGGLFWMVFGTIGLGWFCMLRLERHRTAAPIPVQHVVNHHVFHGLPGAELPTKAVPGVVEQVPTRRGSPRPASGPPSRPADRPRSPEDPGGAAAAGRHHRNNPRGIRDGHVQEGRRSSRVLERAGRQPRLRQEPRGMASGKGRRQVRQGRQGRRLRLPRPGAKGRQPVSDQNNGGGAQNVTDDAWEKQQTGGKRP